MPNNNNRNMYPKNIKLNMQRAIGIESEIYVTKTTDQLIPEYRSYYVPDKTVKRMRQNLLREHHRDSGAVEFTTIPIGLDSIKKGPGKKRLEQHFRDLASFTRVSDNNGTHIHISRNVSDHENMVINTLMITQAFSDPMRKILGRISHWAKTPGESIGRALNENLGQKTMLDKSQLAPLMEQYGNKDGMKQYERNYLLITPTSRGTMEMRGPKGSNDYHEVMAWVELLENITEAANKESVQGLRFGDLLKGEYLAPYIRNLYGTRQITIKDRMRKLDEENLTCA